MWPRFAFLVMMFLSITAVKAQTTIDDLHLYTENYAPLNYEENGQVTGITVDVLVEMLKRAGSQLGYDDIQLVPWARGYNYLQNKPNTVLFATTKTEARTPLFQWVGPITEAHIVLIGKDHPELRLENLDNLGRLRIAAIQDDVGHQLLLEHGVSPSNLHVVSQPENAMRLLRIDRAQYWAYEKIVASWYLNNLGKDRFNFRPYYTLKSSKYYFALSLDTDKKIVQKLQHVLDSMREDGQLRKIIERYIPNS